jgi:hypothetical protein
MPFAWYSRSKAFIKDYEKLDKGLQAQVDAAIEDLFKDPIPASRRFEKLRGYKNPSIHTIHVTTNHSHKISLEIREATNNEGKKEQTLHLRRVQTHKEIDRVP